MRRSAITRGTARIILFTEARDLHYLKSGAVMRVRTEKDRFELLEHVTAGVHIEMTRGASDDRLVARPLDDMASPREWTTGRPHTVKRRPE